MIFYLYECLMLWDEWDVNEEWEERVRGKYVLNTNNKIIKDL